MKKSVERPPADADVRQILEEERRQEQALIECRQQAAELIQQARQAARRIEARADERVRRVHEIGDRLIAAELAAIERDFEQAASHSDRTLPDDAAWERAIDQTARRLLGLPPATGAADGRS